MRWLEPFVAGSTAGMSIGTSPLPTGGGGGSQFFEQLLSWLLAMLAALWNALGGN